MRQETETALTPLKNALTEFKKDQKKLPGLLSTAGKAADRSGLISSLGKKRLLMWEWAPSWTSRRK